MARGGLRAAGRVGLLPQGTELLERPSWVPAWDSLSSDERRLFARMMEVYAGFMTHTDAQIGRLLDFVEQLGELDDTLVIVMSDNGASAEGGPKGSFNEQFFFNLVPESLEENLRRIDDLGGPQRTTTIRGAGRGRATRRSSVSSATRTRAASATR